MLSVLQAPVLDGLSLDPSLLFDDGRSPAEVGVYQSRGYSLHKSDTFMVHGLSVGRARGSGGTSFAKLGDKHSTKPF